MQNIQTKNKFDEIIEKMITENINGIDDSLYNLENTEKISKVFKTVDSTGLFSKLDLSKKPKMDHLKSVITMLKDYVKVGEVKKKEAGEVMTPLEFVKEMVSVLPEETWTNPNLKILDPANGTGPYPIMVLYKLMVGLQSWEPDEEKRYKHIVENMIYVCEIQPRNMFLYMCAVDPWDKYSLNVYTGSFLEGDFDKHMKDIWNISRFDIVIGNPPYQEMDGGAKASAKPIYNLFIEKSIIISEKILFVTPSRWFAGGKGLEGFRKMMMDSNKIRVIKHFDDACDIFGKSVDITGGVSYFLYEHDYFGKCLFNNIIVDIKKYDIIVNPNVHSVVDEFSKYESISSICMGRGDNTFGIQTNDNRISNTKIDSNYVRCFVSKNKGFEKWIDSRLVKRHRNTSKIKVITAEANGVYPRFGNKFIGENSDVCSGSYIWFVVDSLEEAKSLVSYLDCKIVNYLLSLRKISQHIKPDTCKWIPMVPFDRVWSDELIIEYFNINREVVIPLLNNNI